jgi:hypothetical protein
MRRLFSYRETHTEESTLFIHRAIYSKFVNIFVGVFAKVRVSVIYTNCPSERYNQIVRRTVYIVEIINNVLSSAGCVPFPTLMHIVSAHIIPYDVHEYFVFQKI